MKYISATVFIAFLAISLVLAGGAYFSGSFQVKGVLDMLNGKASSAYEKEFDKNLKHRDISIDAWNAAGFGLFGEGREGVLIGQDGWLFTNEEFSHNKDFEKNIQKNKQFIRDTSKQLTAQNIKLVIVPIPSKARIYKDKLGRYKFPSYWQSQYQDLLSFLGDNNIPFVDLLDTFRKNKLENIYLKTDTHWTPLGARLASLKIDYYIADKFPYLSWPLTKFQSKKLDKVDYEGDLMRYTVNGGLAEKLGLKKDNFTKWETSSIDNADIDIGGDEDLFGDVYLPVTLVGTSYSTNKTWNFEGFLKEVLGTDILNVADEGLGPFEVMSNYLSSDAYKETKPKIVIWEMPERYLPMVFIQNKKKEDK